MGGTTGPESDGAATVARLWVGGWVGASNELRGGRLRHEPPSDEVVSLLGVYALAICGRTQKVPAMHVELEMQQHINIITICHNDRE